MGQTVVFTVPLDADGEVGIERTESREPPRHPFLDALRALLRDRHWRIAAALSLAAPATAALTTWMITGGAWATTAYLVAAGLVVPASAAWAGAHRPAGSWDERAAQWTVTGLAGSALAMCVLPGVLVASRSELGDFLGPTLATVALAGAAGAWLGMAVGGRLKAAVWALAIAVVPLGLFAALLPSTEVTEQIESYDFVAGSEVRFGVRQPSFRCDVVLVEATRRHTEAITWIAFGSPATWVMDAASLSGEQFEAAPGGSVARAHAWMRSTQAGPDDFVGHCYQPTSLATPTSVKEARYEKQGSQGVQLAAASAILAGAAAFVIVALRRQSAEVTVTVSEPTR